MNSKLTDREKIVLDILKEKEIWTNYTVDINGISYRAQSFIPSQVVNLADED